MLCNPLYLLHYPTASMHHYTSLLHNPLCLLHNHTLARSPEQSSPSSSMPHPLPMPLFNSLPLCCHSNQRTPPPSHGCQP